MENPMVIFLECLALGSVILAVLLGFGKKYHNEEIQKKVDQAVEGRVKVTQKILAKNIEKYLNILKAPQIQRVEIINDKGETIALVLSVELYEDMREKRTMSMEKQLLKCKQNDS